MQINVFCCKDTQKLSDWRHLNRFFFAFFLFFLYFGNEPWYHPAASNDDIRLSLVEQLNVELIQQMEAK